MRHLQTYKLAATYKMTLRYFLVNIHINNQPILYKVNGIVYKAHNDSFLSLFFLLSSQVTLSKIVTCLGQTIPIYTLHMAIDVCKNTYYMLHVCYNFN
jgi:hypothetical protein